jgi:hypothetical protein
MRSESEGAIDCKVQSSKRDRIGDGAQQWMQPERPTYCDRIEADFSLEPMKP